MAKNSKCTGRENISDKRDIKFLSFQICVVTTYQHRAAFVFVTSVFGEDLEVYNS
jgi:hypothetical protein